jgi:hypothetical protein
MTLQATGYVFALFFSRSPHGRIYGVKLKSSESVGGQHRHSAQQHEYLCAIVEYMEEASALVATF